MSKLDSLLLIRKSHIKDRIDNPHFYDGEQTDKWIEVLNGLNIEIEKEKEDCK